MRLLFFVLSVCLLLACNNNKGKTAPDVVKTNDDLSNLFNNYWEERMKLFPLDATQNGDSRYNDQMEIGFTDSFRDKLREFYSNYLNQVVKFESGELDDNDRISYNIFKREMEMQLEGLKFHDNYIPFNQFWAIPLDLGQLGSGESSQPFKTDTDYYNWITRVKVFAAWADSAIVYFKKGIDAGIVLPKPLVLKMIPQMNDLANTDTSKNIYFAPLKKLSSSSFSQATKDSISRNFVAALYDYVLPSYKKLAAFLQSEYLPKARTTTGIGDIPEGKERYSYLVKSWTTTNKTPDEIYNTGLAEVKRVRTEMERIKNEVGFKGDLKSFFEYMRTDPKFKPFKTPGEVLNAFYNIHKTMEPNLKKMFGRTPSIPFEIRQTEAFRAASASAEYNKGTSDGSRPGIFYVPILDATKFNITSGMESLFLHEAIPGHHYQISLQMENKELPKFRQFAWYGAYGEGWALYCESLGKELGLYTDPYQYMGALGDEMHRAIRLVVDVGMHLKGMTREEAIKYMMENEALDEQGTTAEIERYMAIPGQALSYKNGALKIWELRNKYTYQLGNKFKLSTFHDDFLKDGVMPLEIAERKMDSWAEKQK